MCKCDGTKPQVLWLSRVKSHLSPQDHNLNSLDMYRDNKHEREKEDVQVWGEFTRENERGRFELKDMKVSKILVYH